MIKKSAKSFYLHTFSNRRLYPASKYPFTHLVDRLNIDVRLSKQSSHVEHFLYTFILLLIFVLASILFFQLHNQVYNTIFGPFHFNKEQFIEYVNTYRSNKDSLFRLKIDYIQVELTEGDIQNPGDTYHTIRRFSDPHTRRHHIATYKRVKHPAIYVKLPTSSRKYFHARYPIHFPSYSIRTLQCVVRNLPLNSATTYQTWIEKSDYVQFINQEYARNASEFNRAVLIKCGILIGQLYRPMYEKAFTPTAEHPFTKLDLAFDMTREYYSFYPFLIGGLIFAWLFFKSIFYLFLYLSNLIRCKGLHRYGILSFPLKVPDDVNKELWLLNTNGSPYEQLLKFDQMLQQSQHQFMKYLFIIQNDREQLFVVIIKQNFHQILNEHDELLPFIICPVTDIQKITQYGGICYGQHASWIRWSTMETNEQNYAGWLHEQLMELSHIYKSRYEDRLRNEQNNELPSYFTGLQSGSQSKKRRKRSKSYAVDTGNNQLVDLIREEVNIQRLKIERQSILENFENLYQPITPATAEFIAEFRQEHEQNQKLIDEDMAKERLECTLCQEEFELNDHYANWPCSGKHVFHYDCMLKSLRVRNTCPNCRHAVEGVLPTSTQTVLSQFLTRVLT